MQGRSWCVCACKNSITTAVDFVAHALIHIDTSISSGKKTSFLFLINTHRTYTQKLIHKNERKKENYDRFCFGWQLTFHLFLFLLKKIFFGLFH